MVGVWIAPVTAHVDLVGCRHDRILPRVEFMSLPRTGPASLCAVQNAVLMIAPAAVE
jgi:hypothetical protein